MPPTDQNDLDRLLDNYEHIGLPGEGQPISYRCGICGMDVTDPKHKPAWCDHVASDEEQR